MDTIVLKFGGSSLSDNEKLKLVANKITDLYDKGHQIVVVLSAQGKTTDRLIKEAQELFYSHEFNKNIFGLNEFFEIDKEDEFRMKGPSKENRKEPL